VEQSDDDISIGEIRFPGSTLKQSHNSALHKHTTTKAQVPPKIQNTYIKPDVPKLSETINYEEDKIQPEREDEKPIYESSEGPISRPKAKFGKGRVAGNVGKSGANNLMSGESFGMNPLKMIGKNPILE
jgi:hypothetical protein